MNTTAWLKHRDELNAIANQESLPILDRIKALTELFFHYGQDRHEAAKVVRRIQDLSSKS